MAVTAFEDLPLADRSHHWDGDEAEKRVREWAGAHDKPNDKYRQPFVWYDENKEDHFTAYKLPIAGRCSTAPGVASTSPLTASKRRRPTSRSTTPKWASRRRGRGANGPAKRRSQTPASNGC
jgi:hypothetical protein